MPFLSVTRLRVRRRRFLLPFFWYNERAVRQIRQAAGFRTGTLFIDAKRTFWTITAWDSREAMLAYRNADAHRAALPKLQHWCDEGSIAHWDEPAERPLPTPPEAHQRMVADGRLSKVRHPSDDHRNGTIPPPRWPSPMMRPLKPIR